MKREMPCREGIKRGGDRKRVSLEERSAGYAKKKEGNNKKKLKMGVKKKKKRCEGGGGGRRKRGRIKGGGNGERGRREDGYRGTCGLCIVSPRGKIFRGGGYHF